jgi:hypothetical protein
MKISTLVEREDYTLAEWAYAASSSAMLQTWYAAKPTDSWIPQWGAMKFICGIDPDKRYNMPRESQACKREFDTFEKLMDHIREDHGPKLLTIYGEWQLGPRGGHS